MPRVGIKTMPAPYNERCADCGQDIHIGDPVVELAFGHVTVTRVGGVHFWLHASCARELGEDLRNA